MVKYIKVVLVGALLALTTAAPTSDHSHNIHYNERQNGTANQRIKIDGIVLAVIPSPESLVSGLVALDDFMNHVNIADYLPPLPGSASSSSSSSLSSTSLPMSLENEKSFVKQDKPDVKPSEEKEKPSEEKPQEVGPQEDKPEVATNDVSLGDDVHVQMKEVSKEQELSQRLKKRMVSFLMPRLRKTNHN